MNLELSKLLQLRVHIVSESEKNSPLLLCQHITATHTQDWEKYIDKIEVKYLFHFLFFYSVTFSGLAL